MPNLPKPRLRRPRRGELVAPVAAEPQSPRVEQIEWGGLRWVNIEHAGGLEGARRSRGATLAGGALRLPRARPRGRDVAQPAAEDRPVRRVPLQRPEPAG